MDDQPEMGGPAKDGEPPGSTASPVGDSAPGKNPHAVALGRLGGLKGGKVAAAKMTPAQRKRRARKAAKARWEKKGRKPTSD